VTADISELVQLHISWPWWRHHGVQWRWRHRAAAGGCRLSVRRIITSRHPRRRWDLSNNCFYTVYTW